MGNYMNKTHEYYLGYTGTYIQDYPFKKLCKIPASVALQWVKECYPDKNMGGHALVKDMTLGGSIDTDIYVNGWLNKMFIIVEHNYDKWIAITNWDGKFYIYIEK